MTFRAGDNSSRSHWPAFSPSPPPLGDTATVGEGKKGKEGGAEREREVVVQCPQAPRRKEGERRREGGARRAGGRVTLPSPSAEGEGPS